MARLLASIPRPDPAAERWHEVDPQARRSAPVLGADLPRALAERGRQHAQARVVEVHACAGVDLGGLAVPGAAVAVLARMGDTVDAALTVAWGPEIPEFAHLLAGALAA